MKKLILIILSATFSFAGVYDYPYLVNSDKNQLEQGIDKKLMYGEFDQILRFEPIFFNSSTNQITEKSQNYLNEIKNVYEKYKQRDLIVTIIGYTDHVQSKTEKVNQSSWFPTYDNDLTIESSKEIALGYATYTFEQLVDKGLPKHIMKIEDRGGLNNLYTRATQEGRELNYRAMVTIYISKLDTADSDNDGVVDSKDKCKFTPVSHTVDKNGCSEVLNLTIHYNVNSSVIRKKSSEKLTKMISFMNKYPEYKVLLFGHTSSEGLNSKNQILSEKRALSIRRYLIQQGVNSSRISTFGKSSTEPLESNDTKEGREENRRVEIKLY